MIQMLLLDMCRFLVNCMQTELHSVMVAFLDDTDDDKEEEGRSHITRIHSISIAYQLVGAIGCYVKCTIAMTIMYQTYIMYCQVSHSMMYWTLCCWAKFIVSVLDILGLVLFQIYCCYSLIYCAKFNVITWSNGSCTVTFVIVIAWCTEPCTMPSLLLLWLDLPGIILCQIYYCYSLIYWTLYCVSFLMLLLDILNPILCQFFNAMAWYTEPYTVSVF